MIVGAAIPGAAASAIESKELTLSEGEFTSFYNGHAEGLRAYLTRRTGNPALAEDLAQKAFVRLLGANLTTLDRPALKAYLYRIATNLANDHWRKFGKESGEDDLPEETTGFGSSVFLRSDFDRILSKIEPRDRSLVWLAHVEEMTHREIAEILDVAEGSVKVMLFRARKRLAEILRREGYTGGSDE